MYDVTMRPGQPLSTLHGPLLKEAPAMTDLTREQRDALRVAAEKATMGPWHYHGPDCCEDDDSDCDATGPEAQVMYYGDSSGQCIAETWVNADAHFIAAANPQTILALLDAADERDTLQQERDAARAAVGRLAGENHSLGCRDCIAYVIGRGCPRVQDAPVGEWVSCRQARKEAAYAPAPVPDALPHPAIAQCNCPPGEGCILIPDGATLHGFTFGRELWWEVKAGRLTGYSCEPGQSCQACGMVLDGKPAPDAQGERGEGQ